MIVRLKDDINNKYEILYEGFDLNLNQLLDVVERCINFNRYSFIGISLEDIIINEEENIINIHWTELFREQSKPFIEVSNYSEITLNSIKKKLERKRKIEKRRR